MATLLNSINIRNHDRLALRKQYQKTGNHNAANSLWRMRFSAVKYALSKKTDAARSSYPPQVAELSL